MNQNHRRLDEFDRKLLRLLQHDADIPISELAQQVNLSTTPCWRRIRLLKESGVIQRQVALLDPDKLNLGMTVFVAVRTRNHTRDWLARFKQVIDGIPEVVAFYRLSGDVDYLLRVVVPDIKAYDDVYKRLIAGIELEDVSSSFVMEQIKYTTALPLDYLA